MRTAILLLATLTGAAYAQNPDVIQDTRSTLQNIQKKQVIDQNAVLNAAGQASPKTTSSTPSAPSKPVVVQTAAKPAATPAKVKPVSATKASPKPVSAAKTETEPPKEEKAAPAVAVEDKKNPVEPKKEKNYSAAGRRDPFVSPVVSRTMIATGCSTGKRCLEIGQIVLTGIVKSDSGMIAVVVNALNKAYFLRENDPVFNGYVVKITGDSIVFQETVQDNLGKPLTREVTKKISTPAV